MQYHSTCLQKRLMIYNFIISFLAPLNVFLGSNLLNFCISLLPILFLLFTGDAHNFEVKFPTGSVHDYGFVEISQDSDIHSFTLALWYSPSKEDALSLVSYASSKHLREIYLKCSRWKCTIGLRGQLRYSTLLISKSLSRM